MKNKRFQENIASSKAFFKRKGNVFDDPELRINILYEISDEPFWWGDFSTYVGSQKLMIWAMHLRMDYMNKCNSIAFENIGWFNNGAKSIINFEPVKKKVGKGNRKKTTCWKLNDTWYEENGKYFKRLEDEEKRVADESDISVTPSFYFQQLDWCLGLNIVTSEELNTKDKVVDFIGRCRKLATHRIPFSELFDINVVYNRDNWKEEAPLREKIGSSQ